MRNYLLIAAAFLAVFFTAGCATVYNPATGREEMVIIDTQQEVLLGRATAARVAMAYPIMKDQEINSRVNRIGAKVAQASDRQDMTYHFAVVKDNELNAFAIPGGYVYVNSGLVDKANDDELASVLAHEVGHIAARHSVKKFEVAMGYRLVTGLVFARARIPDLQRASNVAFNLISLGYSREDELLADTLGVRYSAKAGYNPEGMVAFFKKLQEEEKKRAMPAPPIWLRSHPEISQRITHAEEEIGKLDENIAGSSRITKFCPACGKRYEDKEQFCPNDGVKLRFLH